MIMTPSCHHRRSMTCPSTPGQGCRTPAGDSARTGRNATAPSKYSCQAQRISGPSCTSNNNSMSKAIKRAPTAAAVAAATAKRTTCKAPAPLTRTRTTTSPAISNKERCKHKTDEATTWDEMLSARTKFSSQPSDASPAHIGRVSSLQQFDPQRTLAFLIAELNSKLKVSLPADKTVHRILSEIRSALKRIGNTSHSPRSANVTSDTNLMQRNRVKCCNSSAQTDKQNVRCYEKAAQTSDCERQLNASFVRNYALSVLKQEMKGPAYLAKEVDLSTKDLLSARKQSSRNYSHTLKQEELACGKDTERRFHSGGSDTESPRQRKEMACRRQSQKDEFRQELEKCQKEVEALKKQISALQDQLEAANAREACSIQNLENRCKLLQSELKTLQDIVKKQTNELGIVQDLSAKLKESAVKINHLEKSKLEADRILVFTKLEKEKLAMLRRFQENQIGALQSEINRLTKVVRDQIQDIHQNTSCVKSYQMESATPSIKGSDDKSLEDDTESSKNGACSRKIQDKPNKSIQNQCPLPASTHFTQTEPFACPLIKKHRDQPSVFVNDDDNHYTNYEYPKNITLETESAYIISKDSYKNIQNESCPKKKKYETRSCPNPNIPKIPEEETLEYYQPSKSVHIKDGSGLLIPKSEKSRLRENRQKGGWDRYREYNGSSLIDDASKLETIEAYEVSPQGLKHFTSKDIPLYTLVRDDDRPVFDGRKTAQPPTSPQPLNQAVPVDYTPPPMYHRRRTNNTKLYILEEQQHEQPYKKDNLSHVTSEMESS